MMEKNEPQSLDGEVRTRIKKIKDKLADKKSVSNYQFLKSKPVVEPKNLEPFSKIYSYIKFLKKNRKEAEPELVNFYDRIMNAMVCELYFGNIIHEREDVLDFFREVCEVMSEKNPNFRKVYRKQKKQIIGTLDILLKVLKKDEKPEYRESDSNIKRWVNRAEEHIDSSIDDFKSDRYSSGIESLYEGIETLLKSYAMFLSLVEEKELDAEIGHNPFEVYVKLLDFSWTGEIIDKFDLDISFSQSEIKKKLKKISKHVTDRKLSKDEIENLDKELPTFLDLYDKLCSKIEEKSTERHIKKILEEYRRENFLKKFKYYFSFAAVLLPLSILLSTYYFPSRFPDEFEGLSIKFEDSEVIKNRKQIIEVIRKSISRLRSVIGTNSEISPYMIFTIQLDMILKDISNLNNDRKKNVIKKTHKELKDDKGFQEEMEKVISFEWEETQ